MSLTKSLTDLVNGMKGGETTQNWDVVVSYSVNQLNTLLQSIWASNQASNTLSLTTPYTDPLTQASHTLEWQIQLTSQTLSFTNDGQARLGMKISGKYRGQGKDTAGHDFPWNNVPDGCTFVAHVPLQSVRAKEGDTQGTDATPGHQTITFGDDPAAKLHVVFNFDNNTTSNYTIECPATYQLTFAPLAGQIRLWMQDPHNVSTIQYSLAVVAPTQTVGAIYLTPLSMGFTVYTDGDNACLSVYIQTKDSGNNPGNANRVFNLPNNGAANALPVPTGHSASIIIRRKIFHDLFLFNPLKGVKAGDQLAFKSVTSVDTTSGFSFDIRLDNHIIGDFSSTNWTGLGLHMHQINWDLSQNPLSLNIDGGRVSWSYSGGYHLNWAIPGQHGPWGIAHWDPKLSKSGESVLSTNQGQITASVVINQGDWQISEWAEDGDATSGMRKYIPSEIEDGLDKIQLPTLHQSMRLDYFATTNIFAPGKHVIDIDTSAGVLTPFDVLLVGNVVAHV